MKDHEVCVRHLSKAVNINPLYSENTSNKYYTLWKFKNNYPRNKGTTIKCIHRLYITGLPGLQCCTTFSNKKKEIQLIKLQMTLINILISVIECHNKNSGIPKNRNSKNVINFDSNET